ncbi:MAG TPA: ABC transporter permease, partial [Clostridiales bacterium]|nr:ABC transporter permease [Clostridiales bacterium]
MRMRNLGLLILNNLKVTFRKKGNIITYIFLPLVGVLFSLVIHGTSFVSTLNLGFVDRDHGMAALELKEKLAATEDFSVVEVDEEEINKKLLDFELDAVVVVPEGYTESILSGNAAEIEIVSLKGKETTAWVEQLIYRHSASMSLFSAASGGDPA